MGTRGRTSGASLALKVTNMPGQRPEPPEKLTEAQKDEWRAVVARMPADWFTRENQSLLIEYCRHIERSDVLEAGIREAVEVGDKEVMGSLLKLAKQESEIIVTLATKMRLSQQSRYERSSAGVAIKHETNGTRPWQRTA